MRVFIAEPRTSVRLFDSRRLLDALDRFAPLVAVAVFIGLGVKFMSFKHKSDWNDVYLHASTLISESRPLYSDFSLYTYPPFMAWLAIPFTKIPPAPSRALWLLVHIACFVGMVRIAWGWMFPPASRALSDSERWKRWAVFAFGIVLGGRAMTNCMLHHQTDLVVGLLVFLGIDGVLKSKPNRAAVWFGLAAGLKCTPLLWLAFFCWTGPRSAALVVVLTAVGANLLPSLTHPLPSGTWLGQWLDHVLFGTLEPNKYPGQWNVDVMTNQSLAGSFYAWLTTTWSWDASGFSFKHIPQPHLSTAAAKVVVYGIALALSLVTFLHLRWGSLKSREWKTPNVFHCSMILCLMLLLSPMSHKTHFGLLLVPGFALGRLWFDQPTRALTAALGVVMLLQIVSLRAISVPLASVASWYGAQMLTTAALLVGCWIALHQRKAVALVQPMPLAKAA
jgi:hypothetical protein